MTEKLVKKVERNRKILEDWHKSISAYAVLSTPEIKALIKSYLIATDEEEKVKIRNNIVLGTLEYLYQYLKNSIFMNLICNWFDMEDVIASGIETWIRWISKDSFYARSYRYRIDSNYILYSDAFINGILESLSSNDKYTLVLNNVPFVNEYSRNYYLYLEAKKNNSNFNFADFKTLINNNGKVNYDDAALIRMYQAFQFLDKALIVSMDDVISKNIDSIKYLILFCLNTGDFVTSINGWSEDFVIRRMLEDEATKQIFKTNSITNKRKELLFRLFYLNDSVTEIAEEKSLNRTGVNNTKKQTLTLIKNKYYYLVADWY